MDVATREQILSILSGAADMTLATNRADGFPQATVVSFVNDGLALYFGCGAESQKLRNIRRDPKVSAAITLPYDSWDTITGVSLGGLATVLSDPAEIERVGAMMFAKFPQAAAVAQAGPPPDTALVRVDPVAISVLDYAQGFGHCELTVAEPGGALA